MSTFAAASPIFAKQLQLRYRLSMKEIDLTRLPYAETRVPADTGAPVYLFVNPVEYHGPHLPLKNDHLLSLGMARAFHAKLCQKLNQDWPFIQAAHLHMGVGPAPGPGSVSVPYLTVKKMIRDACRGLAALEQNV